MASPVQKLASAFLYISQMDGNLMGNMQNLRVASQRCVCLCGPGCRGFHSRGWTVCALQVTNG